jgi:hypothetical protein
MSTSSSRNFYLFLVSLLVLSAGATNCFGGSPSVSLSTTSLSFTTQLVYTSAPPLTAPQTVTLTNNGTAALTITSVALGGTDPGDYILVNDCLSTIPASGTCTFSVQFNPQTSGSRSASVQITDNATGSPQSVTLSGTGRAGVAYYVAPNGSDGTNTCTNMSSPCLTLNHAGHEAYGGGDILYVRGGVYLNPSWESFSGNGSAALPVVLAAYQGERPIFTGNAGGALVDVQGSGAIIDGIDFENINTPYALDLQGPNNVVQNCIFHLGSGSWLRVDNGSTNTIIRQNTFDTNGYLFTDGENDGLVVTGGQNVLIENNFFTRCGHYCTDSIYVTSTNNQNIVWKDNTIVQYWGGGMTAMGEVPATQALVEGNRFSHVGEGVHYPKDAWFSNGPGDIVRNNVFTNTAAWFGDSTIGLIAEILGQDTAVDNVHIYNNDVYNDGPRTFYLVERYDLTNHYVENITNSFIANNILSQAANQTTQFGSCSGDMTDLIIWCADTYDSSSGSNANDWPNFPNGNYTENNILNSGTSSSILAAWIQLSGTTYYTFSTLESSYSTYFNGNLQANPSFVAPGDAANGNFALSSGSPAIAAGAHSTTTTAVGTNTTSVPVADPYWFSDGHGVLPGDLVVVGSNPPVRVTAVSYSGDTLTVGSAISFSSGANVDLAGFNGSAPDIGAFPYSSTAPTISSIGASSVNATSETITATTSAAAACQVEYGPTTDYGRTSAVDSSLMTSHSITLYSDLFAGQTYHYALICTNATAGRAISSDQTFTMASATGPAISGVYVSAVSVSGSTASATVSWTTSTSANSQVFYSAAGVVTAYVSSTAISDSGGVTSHNVTLSGLTLNSSYEFVVQSTDGTGITNASPQGVFITPSSGGAGPVFSNISITQTLGPEANYGPPSGTGYGSADSTGIYSCCGYDYVHSTFSWTSSEAVTQVGVNFQTSVGGQGEGALSAELYEQNITGTVSSGSTTISSVSSTAGLQVGEWLYANDICGGTTITAIGTNTITMSKAASSSCKTSNASGITATFNYGVPSSGNPAATTSPQITLYYMPPDSAMLFQIKATDASSNTTVSPWMYWLTPAEDLSETPAIPPQTYMSEQATSIGASGATITWTMPSSGTCEVEYGTTSSYGSTASSGSGTSCSIPLSGLTAGTTYHVAVISTNSLGMSFTGQDFTFTTSPASLALTGKTCAAVGSSSGTSASCTWSTAPSANETILCGAVNNANSAMSMSDNASTSNTYSGDGSRYAGTGIPAYYQFFTSALIANSPTTTTVSASTGNYLSLACISYTGGSSSPIDGTVGTHSQTGGHSISASTTTSNANDVIAGYSQIGYPYTLSATSGWTLLSPSGDTWYGLVYQVTSSSGSQTCTADTNVNSNGDMICGGFK